MKAFRQIASTTTVSFRPSNDTVEHLMQMPNNTAAPLRVLDKQLYVRIYNRSTERDIYVDMDIVPNPHAIPNVHNTFMPLGHGQVEYFAVGESARLRVRCEPTAPDDVDAASVTFGFLV